MSPLLAGRIQKGGGCAERGRAQAAAADAASPGAVQ